MAWIHPFVDGNGRVALLHTYLVLGQMGLTNGWWSPLRGFARSQDAYYTRLSAADEPRAGDLDGRGNLTEAGLLAWVNYVLDVFRPSEFYDRAVVIRWHESPHRRLPKLFAQNRLTLWQVKVWCAPACTAVLFSALVARG